jgi:hypothetical protein
MMAIAGMALIYKINQQSTIENTMQYNNLLSNKCVDKIIDSVFERIGYNIRLCSSDCIDDIRHNVLSIITDNVNSDEVAYKIKNNNDEKQKPTGEKS